MAFDLTQLQAVTDDYIEKTPTDIYYEDCVLLYYLMNGTKFQEGLITTGEIVDGGDNIRVFLEYDKSHSSSYGNTTKINKSKKDIIQAARFRWAGAIGSNSVDLKEQRANTGKAQIVDLAYAKIQSIQKSIRDEMGAMVYASAADEDSILGLGNLFNTTSSTTYGTIAEDDIAMWKANVLTTAGPVSYKVMQSIKRGASVGQNVNKKPNLYITTENLKDAFELTLQAQVRHRYEKLIQAGFDNIIFSNAPMVADEKQSAGIIDGLNTRFLKLKTHKEYAFTRPIWIPDPDQPDAKTANTRWSGQLVCKHRDAHCRHTNLVA